MSVRGVRTVTAERGRGVLRPRRKQYVVSAVCRRGAGTALGLTLPCCGEHFAGSIPAASIKFLFDETGRLGLLRVSLSYFVLVCRKCTKNLVLLSPRHLEEVQRSA
jgi:hypothetical protein